MAKELNLEEELKNGHYKVSIFGSARIQPENPIYKNTYWLAGELAKLGMDVITGGGPGIMQAASTGHKDADASDSVHSIGLNIRLPMEQEANPGLEMLHNHDRFSTRLDEFMLLSNIVVVMPGGVGTTLEFLYTWQLLQINHICRMPVILVGDMWRNLIKWFIDNPLKHKYMSAEDLDFIVLVDDCKEALEVIKKAKEHYEKAGKDACDNWKKYGKKFDDEHDHS